ncbi:MAG: phasin family protein [Spirulinaceae cyanobacterium]
MAGLNQFVKKAFYLGVGLASYAGEKANSQLQELRTNAQALADELVKRGELKAEEAGQFVDELMQQAQQQTPTSSSEQHNSEPRRIEIITDETEPIPNPSTPSSTPDDVAQLRSQVEALQARLRELQQ